MPIRVVAAVIENEGRLLLCRRPAHKRHGGLWEFPGGKVEPGESLFEAVARELLEELGVRVLDAGAVEWARQDEGSEFVIEFLRVRIEGEVRALEHDEVAWVGLEELSGMGLAPSDAEYVRWRGMRTF